MQKIYALGEACQNTQQLIYVCSHRLTVAARLVITMIGIKADAVVNQHLL